MSVENNISKHSKKCAILTLHTPHNFGAMLQAYALQTAVESLGHSCEIIDFGFHAEAPRIFYKTSVIKQLPHTLLCMRYYRAHKIRHYKFVAFSDRFIKRTMPYKSAEDLLNKPPNHDVLLCGSDQIWNPTRNPFHPVYFLKFGRSDAVRIAYAPSFGVKSIDNIHHTRLRELLDGIDCLSCRERSGTELITNLTGRTATHVLDPTLLLPASHWRSIATKPEKISEKYLLVYALDNSPTLIESVSAISIALNLPVVCIQTGIRTPPFPCKSIIREAGPLEFLGYMANAEFVITNSFHGSAFSILFQKPFFSPTHTTGNERMQDLFTSLGIQNIQDLKAFRKSISNPIDYRNVSLLLDIRRETSLNFLSKGILS